MSCRALGKGLTFSGPPHVAKVGCVDSAFAACTLRGARHLNMLKPDHACTRCARAHAHVLQAKPYRRDDYSHSAVQLKQIERDNHLLYTHLTTIASAVSSAAV
jgi:hypothetical protein